MSGLDNVIDSQGFYDFVNHFISGSVFILGIEIIAKMFDNSLISLAYTFIGLLPVSDGINEFIWNVCVILLFALVSFLIGVTAQELYEALYEHTHISNEEEKNDTVEGENGDVYGGKSKGKTRWKKRINKVKEVALRLFIKTSIRKCLIKLFDSDETVVNTIKQRRYRELVKDFAEEVTCIEKRTDDKLVYEWISLFFTYCVYYIQIMNQNKKTEKLRDIEGLSQELSLLFLLLALFSALSVLVSFLGFHRRNMPWLIALTFLYGFLSIVMDLRTERCIKNRIRMTFSIYDAERMMSSERAK